MKLSIHIIKKHVYATDEWSIVCASTDIKHILKEWKELVYPMYVSEDSSIAVTVYMCEDEILLEGYAAGSYNEPFNLEFSYSLRTHSLLV